MSQAASRVFLREYKGIVVCPKRGQARADWGAAMAGFVEVAVALVPDLS